MIGEAPVRLPWPEKNDIHVVCMNLVASCRRSADTAFLEIAVGKGAQSLLRPVEQLERRLLGVVE